MTQFADPKTLSHDDLERLDRAFPPPTVPVPLEMI